MQLQIQIKLDEDLVLPINYHHILQAVIYANLKDGQGLDEMYHDEGVFYEKRNYKLFTFGLLHGKYQVKEKKIIFQESVQFEVRSVDDYFIFQLQKNLVTHGIRFGSKYFKDLQVSLKAVCVEAEELELRMDSPICVYSTDEDNFTQYYDPWCEEFAEAVNKNFIRKYYAAYEEMPLSCIEIEPIKVSKKDRYVTSYKSTYICGWKGIYRLRGEPEYLDFLYQTGLGSKNAQGFGLWELK